MPHQIERVLRALQTEPWAILPDYLDTIVDVVVGRAIYGPTDQAVAASARESGEALRAQHHAEHGVDTDGMRREGGRMTAVIPILGPILHRGPLFDASSGCVGCTGVGEAIDAAVAAGADRIVFDLESPGGTVSGVPELAARIRGLHVQTVAVANTSAASAAYWIAAAADEVVVTPSGSAGSIGVIVVHHEVSQRLARAGVRVTEISAGEGKTDGSPFTPLSEAARQRIEAEVGRLYAMFADSVARDRHVRAGTVRDKWAAHIYGAEDAVDRGLADRIATLSTVLADPAPTPAAMDHRHRRARRAADSRARRRANLC